ncbi:MAG TPA: hypothetical protein DIU15_03895 [Deltaproteobacteria bacterium]|nr:hypothetical protein [Deltaproteobacteria bacterium]HCP45156.1 hypothetical protein [Deltaproteobacteria bacterium]
MFWSRRVLRGLVQVCLALLVLSPSVVGAVAVGDVVVSELLIKSSSAEEWIELYNASGANLALDGCVLREGDDLAALDGLTIDAGAYAILSRTQDCVVFDDAGVCSRVSDFVYGAVTLNDTGSETLEVVCGADVIDSVTYSWEEFEGDCTASVGGTCAVNLAPENLSAELNDDWSANWCVPPATAFVYDSLGRESISTPGAANICPATGPPCGSGDVLISELMVAPPTSSREWFELKVVTGSGCDLHGCVLQEGPFEAVTEENITSEDWVTHTIDAPGNALPLDSGVYALFAKSHDIVGTADDKPKPAEAVYSYSDITFDNGEPGWLHLFCGGVLVDSAPYDHVKQSGACGAYPCSVNLPAEQEHDQANDELANWCLSPEDREWLSSDGYPFYGTPGDVGACLSRDWPVEGDLLFTEVMVGPVSGEGDSYPEWFELWSAVENTVDLGGCRVERSRVGEDGIVDPTSSQDWIVPASASVAPVEGGSVVVFSRGTCMDGFDSEGGPCPGGEVVYESLSFANGEAEFLSLYCPDSVGAERLIDRAGYDMTSTGNRSGHSMEYDPLQEDAAANNDDPFAWCEASFDMCIEGLTTSEGECNYGTPGEVGPCATGIVEVDPSGPGCRCAASGSMDGLRRGPNASVVLSFLVWMLSRRRRSM